ncbi:MAG TPA: M20/M25/M40 family metallo-hydrolase [Terriglobales bacterium]|nr:M20/M25/M40 family metallo-hydrolase [Terriglobales bacterium]
MPALAVLAAFAQTPVDAVISRALEPSAMGANLERLTDQIGGRIPGTPAMQKAVLWGIKAFKAAGADSVHTEDFSIPASWAEGATRMSVVAPEQFKVRAISLAWAPALAPQHRVPIIDVGEGSVEGFAKAGSVAGAIVLVHSSEMHTWDDLFAEYMRAPVAIDLALKGKAVAIAFQSTRPHDLLYRHTNTPDGTIDRLPSVELAREDAARIVRLLASGQKLYADLVVPNRIGGPITTANVIAELRGSEKPEEYVVLGAHLDSWELGTGALDNGCNAALVVDALRAIKASGQRPRRSIRFMLFSGEEEGLLGSYAYVTAHRSEMDKVAGAVIFDSGIGKVTGFSLGGRKDVLEAVNVLAAPLKQFDAAAMTTDAMTGTDHMDFLLEGVPTLVANQEEDNYLINYHAMSDTFDKVDLARLKKHVAEAAAITFAIADDPERIGPRLDRDQISQTLSETHLDDQMKGFGQWDDWASGKRGRQK